MDYSLTMRADSRGRAVGAHQQTVAEDRAADKEYHMALNWDSIDQFRNNRKLDWNAIDEYRTKKSYDPVPVAKAPTQSQLIVTDRTSKIQSAQNMLSYYQSSLPIHPRPIFHRNNHKKS